MEKLPLDSTEAEHASSQPRWNRAILLRRIFVVVFLFIGYYLFTRPSSPSRMEVWRPATTMQDSTGYARDPSQDLTSTKIPLEAHIMSKCPDAQQCFQHLLLPAMEQISDKVDFRLSFIASVSERSSEIECKHGPTECIGDMLMLCAANLPFPPTADESLLPSAYPRTPIIRSLGFANCLLNDFPRIPEREFVHECALEHGIDFDALNRCASQQNDNPDDGNGNSPVSGIALLRNDAIRSEKLGIKISCTVRLDEKVWCVRDGGEWKDCVQDGKGSQPSALIDEVKRLWEERN